jgi:uncharacterized protein involved in response to NO
VTARRTIPISPAARGPVPSASETARPPATMRALLLAPHRLAFFNGALMLVLVSLAWAGLLAASSFGMAVVTTLPPTLAHGFIFTAAYMPLFIAGFMFTAGPRWLDVPTPPAARLLWPVRLHATGIVLLLVGSVVSMGVAAFGALLLVFAWTAIGIGFVSLLRTSRARDKLHAHCVLAFWITGIAAALLFASGLATHYFDAVAAAAGILVFGFVAPITVTVAHRVLPFFTSNAIAGMVPWRPNWVLGLLIAGVLTLGALQLAGRFDLLEAQAMALLTLLSIAPMGVALAALAVRWGLMQSLRGPSLRLVAMLHLAFLWIPIALVLAAVDAALLLLFGTEAPRLGMLPLHALTIGFLGSMLFAMATRVISGHGGLAVTADGFVWVTFWLLQATALLRLSVATLPQYAGVLSAAAATLWTAVWAAWAARYLPLLMRPRADGRPG